MRSKLLIIAAITAASLCCLGQKTTKVDRIARAGGEVVRPGTFTGKVAIISQQSKLPADDCEAVAKMLAELTQCNIVAEADEKATIRLYLIDAPNEPVMLLAPEDHWGKLNLARMVDDLPGERAKEKFFASRARKMIIKSLSLLMGGGSSQFPGNIMNATTMRELDQCQESVPVDMVDNYTAYLKAIGVKPAEKTTYRKACREGWAPQPTNDVQRTIWNQVHQVPDKPITIEFDPKKDK